MGKERMLVVKVIRLLRNILEWLFSIVFIIGGASIFVLFRFNIIDQSMTYYYTLPDSIAILLIVEGCLILISKRMQIRETSSMITSSTTDSSRATSSITNSNIAQSIPTRLLMMVELVLIVGGILILIFGGVELMVFANFYEMALSPIYTLCVQVLFLGISGTLLLTPLVLIIIFLTSHTYYTHHKGNERHANLFPFQKMFRSMFIWQKRFSVVVFIVAGLIGLPTFVRDGIAANFFIPMDFSQPAYDLPSGAHHNTDLDNSMLVDPILLASLEKGLWKMTTVRQEGGFPMYVEPDGSKYYGDRGPIAPYYPGEFSMQESTPYIAKIYLKMYQLEPNPVYLQIAEETARALLKVQDTEHGGFYYDGRIRSDGTAMQPHPLNPKRAAMLDDNTMQSCMEFLLDIYNETENITYYNAIMSGFDCIDEMESDIGGWMQRSNYAVDEYPHHITLNDNCLLRTFNLYMKAFDMFGDPRFWDPLERAARFLINVQGNGGSSLQKGWGQQYTWNGMPAWARVFEPKAISSADTVDAIRILTKMYVRTGNLTYLEPIDPAIDWLNDSSTKITYTIGETEYEGYSRLYELQTNQPIYGIAYGGERRKPEYVYLINQARPGYAWQGDFGVGSLFNDIIYFRSIGYNQGLMDTYMNPAPNLAQMQSQAEYAASSQDTSGFWYNSDGQIQDDNFWINAESMINYFVGVLD